MLVNIVMLVTCARSRLTKQSLYTLARNTPEASYNLTIIHDGLPDVIWTELLPRNKAVMLTVHPSKHITGLVRNLGIYFIEKYWGRGDLLYLTDNDMFNTPGWLEKLCGLIDEFGGSAGYKLLGGWNHPYLQPKETWGNKTRIASHDAVAGASQLMRWETWDKYGPLDAHAVGVQQSEDWKFCQDIIKDGCRVGSVYPRVVFNCGLTNSFGQPSPGADVMLKELQEAKKQYPDLYWE